MPGIFISYRREDSAGHAGRLFDRLAEHFGRERVFMDVVGIEAGLDFVDAIDKALSSTEVMVAVIGRNWLTGKDSAGQPRLSDPKDFIRLETGTALRRGIRVVPVLVQGAPMPAASDLPEDLVLLARRQAVELSDSRWDSDVSRFVKMLEGMASGGKKKLLLWSAIAVAVLAIGGGLAWYFQPTTVPDLVGKSREEARAALRTARLSPGKEALRAGSGRSPGMVIDQRPAAGERAARGTPVDIAIATETAVIRGNAVLSTSQLDFGTQTLAVMGAPAERHRHQYRRRPAEDSHHRPRRRCAQRLHPHLQHLPGRVAGGPQQVRRARQLHSRQPGQPAGQAGYARRVVRAAG